MKFKTPQDFRGFVDELGAKTYFEISHDYNHPMLRIYIDSKNFRSLTFIGNMDNTEQYQNALFNNSTCIDQDIAEHIWEDNFESFEFEEL